MKKVKAVDYEKPSKFARFPVGESRIRVVSDIYLYQKFGKKMGGRFISQIIVEGAPIPDIFTNDKPKNQWGFIAFIYRLDEFRIMEVGPVLGDMVAKLMKENPDYKDKDILVGRTGLTMHDTKYTVAMAPESQELPKRTSLKAEYAYYLEYFEPPKEGK